MNNADQEPEIMFTNANERVRFILVVAMAASAVGLLAVRPTVVSAAAPTGATQATVAQQLLNRAAAAGGVCALVGNPDAQLAIAIAQQGPLTVHCLASSPAATALLQKSIGGSSVADAVSVITAPPGPLPYIDNLLNILIIDLPNRAGGDAPDPADCARVLAPLGTLFVRLHGDVGSAGHERQILDHYAAGGIRLQPSAADAHWLAWRKPWPTEIDQWTHYLHGADGNPVARDTVVAPPKHYQWVSEPKWLRSHEADSTVSTIVTARGRLFYIVDEAPASLLSPTSPPGKWFVEARDAFNGVLLWKVPIRRWGWREWKPSWFTMRPGDYPLTIRKTLVAVGDQVYVTLGYKAPVSALDARTGAILKTYPQTDGAIEVLCHDGTLVVAVRAEDGCRVVAVDATSGKTVWRTESAYAGTRVDYLRWSRLGDAGPPAEIEPALNIATDGQTVALIDKTHLVGLDFKSGKQRWRAAFPLTDQDQRAGNIPAKDSVWNGTMIVTDGVVLHASPYQLAGFAAETGKVLWSQPKAYLGHLWYEWKDVFVIDGLVWTWSSELEQATIDTSGNRQQRQRWPKSANGYDLHSGKLVRSVPVGPIFKTHHHHRCYRDKATTRFILASRRGSEYVDLTGGPHSVNNWVRGTCHVGMMPANGLQYAPPHPCVCYDQEKLIGMNALAPQREDDTDPEKLVPMAQRLVHGPAWNEAPVNDRPAESLTGQWPAFRHDGARTGAVQTTLGMALREQWRVPLGKKVTPPTAVGDHVFVAATERHAVICLDARSGAQTWSVTAGARIDSPPTYYRGTILFGANDGWVTCLRADDGRLVWKFMAAPKHRLMAAFGQLESAWPVPGSVVIRDGLVYCAAGRSSELDGGIFLYALDAASGRVVHQHRLQGPEYNSENIEINYRLPMGALNDVLIQQDGDLFLHGVAFDTQLRPRRAKPGLDPGSGLLDDSYFKRMPWRFGQQYGRLLVHDNRSVYFVRMFDSLRGLDPRVYFTPSAQGYLLFGRNINGRADTWRFRVPIRIGAMLLAGTQLVAAGAPDKFDSADPWGAFEGRNGGSLLVVDTAAGVQQQAHVLKSPPVFNGVAAAGKRLYVVDQQGCVACWQ